MTTASPPSRLTLTGAAAGILATLAFTLVHHVLISNIWGFFSIMSIAGAICGAAVSWSYSRLVDVPSLGSWLGYNALHVGALLLLGVVSLVVFEPVTSMAALMNLNGPPDDLIGQALPMTAIYTLLAAALLSLVYRRGRRGFGAILLTTGVLVVLLGLNVSVLGLVSFAGSSLLPVLAFLGLIILINLCYVTAFVALQRRMLLPDRRSNPELT